MKTLTEITNRIREDYGTLKRYARIKGISYYTLTKAIKNQGNYKVATKILIQDGYMQCLQKS